MSRHGGIRDAILSQLQGLTLTGVNAANIVAREVPIDRDLTTDASKLPAVVVCACGVEKVDEKSTTTKADGFGYPTTVVLHKAKNADYTADDTFLLWRQTIVDHFLGNPLSGVTGAYKCTIEYGPIIDPEAWRMANMVISALTIVTWQHRART